jgi:hypothetical protein
MPKGTEHGRSEKKKAKYSLKEKRLRKKEKKQRVGVTPELVIHEDFNI